MLNTPSKRKSELFASVKPLASLSAVLLYLAEAGHDRLTINQAAFFLLVAAADARGRPLTLTEIMEKTDGILGRSIVNSYKTLLEPHGRQAKDFALGWLTREPDPDDERQKFLRLTEKGKSVAKAALMALGEGAYGEE
jgi:hypothetical protein